MSISPESPAFINVLHSNAKAKAVYDTMMAMIDDPWRATEAVVVMLHQENTELKKQLKIESDAAHARITR